jgi:hypothetical protein
VIPDVASRIGPGGAAATGAVTNGDSQRMRETAADSRRDPFDRLGSNLTFCCRNPASP